MARPQRRRRICQEPAYLIFSPDGVPVPDPVLLTLDEFEVIRLVDLKGMAHVQAARQMEISRSTATEIYESARRKLADSLVNGRRLVITGGSCRLCDGETVCCNSEDCPYRGLAEEFSVIRKGEKVMRIAVPFEDGMVYQHFGHTKQFQLFDVEGDQIRSSQVVDTNGVGHGALAGFLTSNQVDSVICGGIGGGAQTALQQAGIRLYGGVSGETDQAVQDLIQGKLQFDSNVRCEHHGQGKEGHSCGHHGCGAHHRN